MEVQEVEYLLFFREKTELIPLKYIYQCFCSKSCLLVLDFLYFVEIKCQLMQLT